MPATVNVNHLTVVHAGSSGMAMSFPDVCKTPTPGGPVPIPYPNIAKSSDTADGSTTVTMDGNPIMLKSSNFQMSSGDEAGSALGVVSNKIKGKALPINTSFDVKVDGKNVFRLTDPMQTNAGSANAMNPAEVQGPLPPGMLLTKECEELKEKRESQTKEIQSKNAGMLPDHFNKIKDIATNHQVAIYFRRTDAVCEDWIRNHHQPKPHAVFFGNTIKEARIEAAQAWLEAQMDKERTTGRADYTAKNFGSPPGELIRFAKGTGKSKLLTGTDTYSMAGDDYAGVVGMNHSGGLVEPLKRRVGVPNLNGDYFGKWITADYDIFMILWAASKCDEVPQDRPLFNRIKDDINSTLEWDAIQHGPQTQWISNPEETEAMGQQINFPNSFKAAVKTGRATGKADAKIEFKDEKGNARRKPMNVIDKEVTVISAAGAVFLETQGDVLNALLSRECDK